MEFIRAQGRTLRNAPLRIMITGEVGEGKTQSIRNLIRELEKENTAYSAILAEGTFAENIRQDFSLRLLPDDTLIPLCSRSREAGWFSWRRWWFNPEAFLVGTKHLLYGLDQGHMLLLDEAGQLEMEGLGWATLLDLILPGNNTLIITCRNKFSEQIAARWPAEWQIFNPKDLPPFSRKIIP